MSERIATCSCGALQAVARGEPVRASVCHCLDCKRRTGSAFSYNATFAADQVTTSGASTRFERTSDDGFWGAHHFCPGCASRSIMRSNGGLA